MADWETRAGTLTNLRDGLENAKDYQQFVDNRTTFMMAEAGAGEWLAAFAFCNQAFEAVRSALSWIYYIKSPDPLEFAITYFLETYTTDAAAEYDLTWSKILAAWIDAPRDGRLQTVLTIDELRRSVWDDEFTYFKIAEPPR